MNDRSAVHRSVPILRYLAVHDQPTDPAHSVDAALFGDHLDALLDSDYIPLTLSHLITAISIDAPLPKKSVVITFDQGLRSYYEFALPALKHRDIPSTLFVVTGFIGRESRTLAAASVDERTAMTWSQLRDLEGEDVVVGSNGHTYRPLDVMTRWEAAEELALSRSLLEHQLERNVTVAAYPAGLTSPAVETAAARVGFRAACTLRGAVSSNYENPFTLSRIAVDGAMRPEILLAHLAIESRRPLKKGGPLRSKVRRTVRRMGTFGGSETTFTRSEANKARRIGHYD